MSDCIDRGLTRDGILPGGFNVKRRAKAIFFDALIAERGKKLALSHVISDWMSVYAMAVSEENAAEGKVVTAPTNGAAGVVPAVLRYFLDHVPGASSPKIEEFLLTAAASVALRGGRNHIIPLGACIETLRQTGQDMSHKYKETSLDGLAVSVPNC